jgi:two-component system chemotaxis sensor kinase CheA
VISPEGNAADAGLVDERVGTESYGLLVEVGAIDAEFAEIFREEAAGRLDAILAILLDLERGGSPPDAVNALFREAHTLKGAAGMLELDSVYAAAHEMEQVLSDARAAGSALPPDLLGPLRQAADALAGVLAGIGERPQTGESEPLI